MTPEVLLTLEEGALRKWQLGPADAQCAATGAPGDGRRLWGGAAHPRNGSVAAAVAGNSVQVRIARSARGDASWVVAHIKA